MILCHNIISQCTFLGSTTFQGIPCQLAHSPPPPKAILRQDVYAAQDCPEGRGGATIGTEGVIHSPPFLNCAVFTVLTPPHLQICGAALA